MSCSQGRITCYKETVSLIFVNWLILRHNAILYCVGGRFHWLQQGTLFRRNGEQGQVKTKWTWFWYVPSEWNLKDQYKWWNQSCSAYLHKRTQDWWNRRYWGSNCSCKWRLFQELEITSWLRTVFSAERGREHYLHKDCIRGHSPFQNWEHRNKMEAHCG